MKQHIYDRVIKHAEYIIKTGDTVRGTGAHYKVSKSTVHMDITFRLPKVNTKLYSEVKQVMEHNKALRHIRGGEATKNKYCARNSNVAG